MCARQLRLLLKLCSFSLPGRSCFALFRFVSSRRFRCVPLRSTLHRAVPFRSVSSRFVSSRHVTSRHVSFRFVSFRFVSFRFVSFRFVSFVSFVSFRLVPFRSVPTDPVASIAIFSSLVVVSPDPMVIGIGQRFADGKLTE